jgi:hypothetical protein
MAVQADPISYQTVLPLPLSPARVPAALNPLKGRVPAVMIVDMAQRRGTKTLCVIIIIITISSSSSSWVLLSLQAALQSKRQLLCLQEQQQQQQRQQQLVIGTPAKRQQTRLHQVLLQSSRLAQTQHHCPAL